MFWGATMIKINGKTYEGQVIYNANFRGDVSATFKGGLSDEEITDALNAKEIAVVDNAGNTLAIYSLIKWRGMEQSGHDLIIFWQTYVLNEVEGIKTDTEDLTAALLELAEIVGGGNG